MLSVSVISLTKLSNPCKVYKFFIKFTSNFGNMIHSIYSVIYLYNKLNTHILTQTQMNNLCRSLKFIQFKFTLIWCRLYKFEIRFRKTGS